MVSLRSNREVVPTFALTKSADQEDSPWMVSSAPPIKMPVEVWESTIFPPERYSIFRQYLQGMGSVFFIVVSTDVPMA